jgi:two-component system, OmpR family, response regulator
MSTSEQLKPRPAPSVLIVDDDAGVRTMLGAALRRQGYVLETAANGAEAIDRLTDGTYSVVLLDLLMPNVDGFEVLKYLRERRPEAARCLIVMTALTEASRQLYSYREVVHVVKKPFDLDDLLSRINSCIQSR